MGCLKLIAAGAVTAVIVYLCILWIKRIKRTSAQEDTNAKKG